ncbi:MAG: hypothetical protein A2Z20_08790 [Bdellovibrionales bacterium RBG_16_40_8]|nr:MAG: hypothetical protein A2Z20_08790 [Bdellovibrionales bacterium RBG_16_40_8]
MRTIYSLFSSIFSLFILVVFNLVLSSLTFAAPMPLTSSSIFISGQRGLFHSPVGFSIHLANTDWVQIEKPKDNSYIDAVYRAGSDNNIQAALTVRTDKITDELSSPVNLENYAQKWMKDYPRFGFVILTAKKVRVGESVGYMLDLVNRDNSKQLRQVLFVKNKYAVTLTCRDDVQNFSQTLKSCNEIMRTFSW